MDATGVAAGLLKDVKLFRQFLKNHSSRESSLWLGTDSLGCGDESMNFHSKAFLYSYFVFQNTEKHDTPISPILLLLPDPLDREYVL